MTYCLPVSVTRKSLVLVDYGSLSRMHHPLINLAGFLFLLIINQFLDYIFCDNELTTSFSTSLSIKFGNCGTVVK